MFALNVVGCRQGSAEEKATLNLEAGKPVDIYVEYDNLSPAAKGVQSQPALMRGVVCPMNLSADPLLT